jgi:hypothetical protein
LQQINDIAPHAQLRAQKDSRMDETRTVKEEELSVVNALITSHAKTLKILDDSLADRVRKTALAALQTEIKRLELNAKLIGKLIDTQRLSHTPYCIL